MKEKILYCLWVILYAICAALGFLGEVFGVARVFLVMMAVLFFVPPTWLLVLGHQQKDKKILRRLRILSALSLTLTLVVFVATIACVQAPAALGNILHILLVMVSAPMLCGQYWVLSLFLWACLLFATFLKRKR